MPTVSAPTLSTILCQRAGRSLRDGLWGGERLRRPAARALARIAAAALLLVAATLLTGVQAAPVNRLAGSDDPYLRSHAHDPVDWYPWGREALDKARRENKPIFLSIGYSSCWWCHVAQRDLFSNPQIAALMNRWFVNILVDREQRPDINQIYMLARQIMTGQSGWPNQVFLTPSLEPFYIGSYFPPKTTPQAQGFPTLLRTLHRNWVEHRPEVERIAGDIARAMRAAQPQGPPPPLAPAAWANAAQQQALARFDPLDGGFPAPGSAQQFPQPPLLGFLLARGANGHVRAGDAAVFTLQAMLEGGITDQLTGGVRRYSTDPGWSLPHFERMLSDNAQLLALYARAAQARHDPLLRWQAQRLARVLTRDFALPGGGFATAFDAASGGREGGSDLWTRQQIERVLGPQAARRWFALYELTPLQAGDRAGVLRLRRDVAEKLAQQGRLLAELQALGPQRRALLAARDRRPQPKRDDKLVVADNALAIAALSAASMTLDDAALLAAAQRAAERIWQQAWNAATHTLSHQLWRGKPGNPGDLADYGEYIRACLALWATSHDTKWRERAVAVAQAMLAQFAAPDGALRAAPPGDDLPPFPVPPQGDGPRPAAQTAAIAALLDLATIDPDTQRATRWAAAARAALAPLQALVAARPVDWPQLLQVISRPGSEKALGLRAAVVSSPSGAASAGGGAALLAPTPPVRSAAGAAARPAECDGLPVGGCSADVVQVRLRWAGPAQPGGRRPLEVQIDIAPGFHVNAHPASQPGLIATTLLLAGRPLPGVRYPAAQLLRAPFAPKGLAVWSGQVTLRADVPQPAPPLALQVQACNDTACLVPVNLPLPLPPG